jgi:hypothetical protein
MLDPIALLQSLTLPAGAISGQRIVLDGTQGNIRIYDAANHLVVLIDPVGFIELYSTTTGNLIATMDDQGFTSYAAATTGLRTARLQQSGLFIYDVNGDISGVWDDTGIGLQVVPADNFFRYKVGLDGLTGWGSGAAARDVNLYRAAANVLKTDDAFNAVIDSQVNGKSLPRGVMDIQSDPNGFGPASAETTIATANAVAFDGVQRARIILHVGLWNASVLADTFDFRIKEGATTLQTVRKRVLVAGANQDGATIVYTTPVAPSAGNHTYSATFLRVAGTGTLTIPAAGTAPVQLTVEPVGSG